MHRNTGAPERIRVGPASWSYPDWEGQVYPKPKPRGFDLLRDLAPYFGVAEINAPRDRIPGATTTRRAATRASGR